MGFQKVSFESEKTVARERIPQLSPHQLNQELFETLGFGYEPDSGSKEFALQRVASPHNLRTILQAATLDQLQALAGIYQVENTGSDFASAIYNSLMDSFWQIAAYNLFKHKRQIRIRYGQQAFKEMYFKFIDPLVTNEMGLQTHFLELTSTGQESLTQLSKELEPKEVNVIRINYECITDPYSVRLALEEIVAPYHVILAMPKPFGNLRRVTINRQSPNETNFINVPLHVDMRNYDPTTF